MRALSISAAWDEAKAVLAREGRLLVPVALAMVALPALLSGLIDPARETKSLGVLLVLFLLSLIGMIGQLALIRLAIGPSVSVGEAIAHSLRRAPSFIGALVLLILGVFLLMLPLIIVLAVAFTLTGAAASADPAELARSPLIGVAAMVFVIIGLFVGVRMMMISPVASAENVGPVTILRRSWELTRGSFWRLLAFLLLFVIAFGVANLAVTSVAGVIAQAAFGDVEPFSGAALFVALVSGVISALVTVLFSVMLARIYLQLAGRDQAEVSVPSTSD